MSVSTDWLDAISWNTDGLIPVIAQASDSGKVLMLAWMNRAALEATVAKGEAVYWSRSRQRLWHKGESSGNTQHIKSIRLDCDSDALLLEVEQSGGVACHTGRHSCFYQELRNEAWQTVEAVITDPSEMYGQDNANA